VPQLRVMIREVEEIVGLEGLGPAASLCWFGHGFVQLGNG
jgi:hypothetical protein